MNDREIVEDLIKNHGDCHDRACHECPIDPCGGTDPDSYDKAVAWLERHERGLDGAHDSLELPTEWGELLPTARSVLEEAKKLVNPPVVEAPENAVDYLLRLAKESSQERQDMLREQFEPGGSTPSQYALPGGATELQDLIEYRGMSFSEGNIFKALYRLGQCDHSNRLRDLRKMAWFTERLIRLEESDD